MNTVDIFLEHMAVIVFIEKRTFSYKDFLSFDYDGKGYKFEHGTIGNIFSKLKQEGKIERTYRSSPTFYTLPGSEVKKIMKYRRIYVTTYSHKTLVFFKLSV